MLGLVELRARYYRNRLAGRLWPELALVDRLVEATGRGCVVDVGANVGLYTYHFSRRARSVVAFEPLPPCAEKIRKAGLRNVRLIECALSNRHGTQTLYVPLRNGKPQFFLSSLDHPPATAHQEYAVPLRELDDFGLADLSLVKIDVEGHESEVIEGARRSIREQHPLLHVEIEQRHLGSSTTVRSVIERIEELGYRGFMLERGVPAGAERFRYEAHQQPFEAEVASGRYDNKSYANNFLFVPRSSPDLLALALSAAGMR